MSSPEWRREKEQEINFVRQMYGIAAQAAAAGV